MSCPSIGECINNVSYIYTLDYYTVIKINELATHENTLMNLKCRPISERNHSENIIYYIISMIENSPKCKTVEMENISGYQWFDNEALWLSVRHRRIVYGGENFCVIM